MNYAEDLVRKYVAVLQLAEQGAPGERDNAQRIAAKMRTKYPGIEQDAARMRQAESQPNNATQASNGNFGGATVNWADKARQWWDESGADWFAFAADVAQQGFGAAVHSITVSALVENNVTCKLRKTGDAVYVTTKIDNDALAYLRMAGTDQAKQTFAREVGTQVAQQVYAQTE
jgi:hypothetical protein